MSRLRIMIPEQRAGKPNSVPVRPGTLKSWVDALPLTDSPEAARRSINALHDINRCQIPVAERLQLLAQFSPLVDTLCTGLKKTYLSAAFPLNDKNSINAGLVEQLCAELAGGYKVAAVELASITTSKDSPGALLTLAVYQSVLQLSRWIVESYVVYSPEPASAWFELHQFYTYAHENGLLERPVNSVDQNEAATILSAYKRIAMLALANPYQLMQGEAADAYQHLSAWTDNCRILPIDQAAPAGIEFVVDLDADKPPYYAHDEAGALPKHGRRLDVSKLVNIVNAHVQSMAARSSKSGAQQNNLFERRQRGLYQRIAQAWAVRSERISRRVANPMQLAIIIGLTNCHYLMSGGAEFSPERDEIEQGKSNLESGNLDSLTLIDTDQTPWVQEEQATRLDTGINVPRTSKFGSPAEIGKDIWEKIFANSTQEQAQQAKSSGVNIVPFLCRQLRESGNGLDAECAFNASMQLRVGDLIAFQMENAVGKEWNIGAVIWLKSSVRQELTFGINRLAEDARAVATKALRGVGSGGEYYRALLTPRLEPREHPTTLITPAAVYDVGSMVALNIGAEMLCARLTKLLDNTYSYSRFRFELTDKPAAALDITKTKRIL
ncbi:MAG: GTPase - translation elongation factor [Gammaproteobacteria bacterium]|nr:MAG: GTPase - translation elongation factor [Gammaproteobacteria bacterium]TND06396.1 MAG: GTPase - translation elongation factor [Gammaproteobacteria bacterium]